MFNNTIRATLLRFCDLSWETLCELKRLLRFSPTGFDADSFSPPSMVAQATNAAQETVCYCAVERAYIVGMLAFNPYAKQDDMYSAGAAIDKEVASLAQRDGVSKLLMILPDNLPSEPDERWIRVVERRLTNPIHLQGAGFTKLQATQVVH